MKKRGFTLVELLAVIVVLALIALITTPIVMNVIEKSRKEAAEKSAEQLEIAAELYFNNQQLLGNFNENTFKCSDGICTNGEEELKISGKGPEAGTVVINTQGEVTMKSVVINGYLCLKDEDEYSCHKTKFKQETTTNGIITVNDGAKTILNDYKIYGNSVQSVEPSPSNPVEIQSVGEKTKNLFDVNNIIDNKRLSLGKEYSNTKRYISNYIDCSNIDGVSINLGAGFAWYDENKQIVSYENKSSTIFRNYVKPAGARYLRVDFDKSVVSSDKVMIVAGNYTSETIPDYEPYGKYKIPVKVSNGTEEIITNIYLDEPLRKAGTSADYIDFATGQITRQIATYTFKGTEIPYYRNWRPFEGSYACAYPYALMPSKRTGANSNMSDLLSTHLLAYSYGDLDSGNYIGISSITKDPTYGLFVRVPSDVATDSASFDSWLQSEYAQGTPLEVYYALDQVPDPKPIELPDIKLFEGYNYIEIDTAVKPSEFVASYYNK